MINNFFHSFQYFSTPIPMESKIIPPPTHPSLSKRGEGSLLKPISICRAFTKVGVVDWRLERQTAVGVRTQRSRGLVCLGNFQPQGS